MTNDHLLWLLRLRLFGPLIDGHGLPLIVCLLGRSPARGRGYELRLLLNLNLRLLQRLKNLRLRLRLVLWLVRSIKLDLDRDLLLASFYHFSVGIRAAARPFEGAIGAPHNARPVREIATWIRTSPRFSWEVLRSILLLSSPIQSRLS